MTVNQYSSANALKELFNRELSKVFNSGEINVVFYKLLTFYTGRPKIDIITREIAISKAVEVKLLEALGRLKCNEPLEYIIGNSGFYGLELTVDHNVLIPRPETEELVEWIINDFRDFAFPEVKNVSILDIGTGSGCIALALKKGLREAIIKGIDISPGALAIAAKNASDNHLDIRFSQADILMQSDNDETAKYDIIVSNPPYIEHKRKESLHKRVTKFEPLDALFVPDEEPGLFYKAIAGFSENHLAAGGRLYFEINEEFGDLMIETMKPFSFKEIMLKKDLNGKDRMIRCIKY